MKWKISTCTSTNVRQEGGRNVQRYDNRVGPEGRAKARFDAIVRKFSHSSHFPFFFFTLAVVADNHGNMRVMKKSHVKLLLGAKWHVTIPNRFRLRRILVCCAG